MERSTKKLDISLFSKSGYLSSLPAASSSDGSVLRYHFPHSSPPYIPIPKQVKGVCVQKREREREREIHPGTEDRVGKIEERRD